MQTTQTLDIQVLLDRIAELELENSNLKQLALTDKLTGLTNRLGYETKFDSLWNLAIREQTAISIAVIDLDYFKQINDTLGHSEGDKVLQKLADILKIYSRSSDVACRLGGDEFVMLYPNTSCESAVNLMLQVKEEFNALGYSLSIGVASLVPEIGQDKKDIFDLADTAVYKAKKDGKNCVRF